MSKKSKASSAKKSPAKKAAKAPAKAKSVKKPVAKKAAPKKSKPEKKKAVVKTAPKKTVSSKPSAKKAAPVKGKSSKPAVNSKKADTKKPGNQKPAPTAKKSAPIKNIQVPVKDKKTEQAVKPAASAKPADTVKKEDQVKPAPNEVLAVTNTIPKTEIKPLSSSKIAAISSSITNPIKKTDSYSVKAEKEPAGKFEMEFVVRSSPEMLFEFLSTPSGLSEWFCDDVNIRNGIYTFIWDGQLQQARLLKTVEDQLVRFQWVDKTDGSYFEFRIQKDDLTNDISLIVTDFAESQIDRDSSKRLWNSQVEKLMHIIGSIF